MRDLDLLVPASELRRATEILTACGFAPAGPPVPKGHHHARAMSTIVDGAIVTIELHHRLLQPTPFLRQSGYDEVRLNAGRSAGATVKFSCLDTKT
jgi:hypothetical protein